MFVNECNFVHSVFSAVIVMHRDVTTKCHKKVPTENKHSFKNMSRYKFIDVKIYL